MSNVNRWTSDHLLSPGGTAIYGAQQRERLRQMADEVRALLGEYRSDLESEKFDGDRPFEPKMRAYLASRPLAALEKHLRAAVNAAGKLDKEYNRRYVELPKKRARKAAEKALEKSDKAAVQNGRSANALNTAASLHGVSSALAETPDGNGPATGATPFLDFLKKSA